MTNRKSLRDLGKDKRGAVLVEFILAIMPILMMFFSFIQLAKMATARHVLQHSTIIAARAAAVISNAHDNNPGQRSSGNSGEVLDAALMGLGPLWRREGGFISMAIDVKDDSSRSDPYGWVTVKIYATYDCVVPMGAILACGLDQSKEMVQEYRMPHQGALYQP